MAYVGNIQYSQQHTLTIYKPYYDSYIYIYIFKILLIIYK
jgi:hypothetical protein